MKGQVKDVLFHLELNRIPDITWWEEYGSLYQGICFDMDGTLLNTEPLHTAAIWSIIGNKSFELSGEIIEEPHQLNKVLCGLCDRDVYNLLQTSPDLAINFTVEEFSSQKNIFLFEKCDKEVLSLALVPNMLSFLNYLKELNIPCVLVSASQNKVINSFITKLGLLDFFISIIGAESTLLTKPHPEPYILALESLNLLPQQCLAIEDSQTGITSAHSAGLTVLKATWF